MALGPVMLDLRGSRIEADEYELLRHPATGGVILFARNFESVAQLEALVHEIHDLREPHLLVAVDHEGGRVQRFHGEFTRLPPCGLFGRVYDRGKEHGLALADRAGWLMAAELRGVGIDFSFAPVLDIDKGVSEVIGDRAFHRDVDSVMQLARRYMDGMLRAGMAAVGKHFPGHGSVAADSHHELPVDERRFEDILMEDLRVFRYLIDNHLAAIMPAHVVYPLVDDRPAGFSRVWLQDVLREQLGFQGAIFSDDLGMSGAAVAGDMAARADAALAAGCDMLLVCNNQAGAAAVLEHVKTAPPPATQARLMRMQGRRAPALAELQQLEQWRTLAAEIGTLDRTPELDLDNDQLV
ncbi:beta-N-acetylhexosaminidase [Methylohalomonas lacus]|uniref:Beta-hexosaminidase n=1 Tax=Methylohalomonas lacus TaxID=398773 RepID=A0AAE3HMP7_9GAMM|nr:beta-N-acetylhexosaminidase [Methylohalomonas lacus]MCS3903922.1 beta-N-acetylhexosaminidase [Methylohalomonas lacus]